MRKMILGALGILAVFCLLLWGCSTKTEQKQDAKVLEKLSGGFDTTAVIHYGDLTATASIIKESPRSCSVAFSAPDTLKDMSFVFQQDQVQVNYKGLAFQFDPFAMPGKAVAKTAVSILNSALLRDDLQIELNGNVLQVEGMAESGKFFMRLDAETGSLMELSIPDEDLQIEFTNFTFF